MVEAKEGRSFIFRLEHGKGLLEQVKDVAERLGIRAGVFHAIGAVMKARLRYYDQEEKRYREIELNRPLELVSCLGNISTYEGEVFVHSHAALADEKGTVYGGHLAEGTIVFAGELYVKELVGIELRRKYDEVTGLNLF
jgi:hypothetical protein